MWIKKVKGSVWLCRLDLPRASKQSSVEATGFMSLVQERGGIGITGLKSFPIEDVESHGLIRSPVE